MADVVLSAAAARVLGSLMEKEAATPEYYPLSLPALTSACNQRSSRNPVMDLSQDEIRGALHELEEAGLAGPVRGGDSRVTKYEHRVGEIFNLRRGEAAVFCVLLLRGAQTAGELRGRTERMHAFAATDEVEAVLEQLRRREPPLARLLPREPGEREARYSHALPAGESAGPDAPMAPAAAPDASPVTGAVSPSDPDRLAGLAQEIDELRRRLAALETKVAPLFE